MDWRVRTRGSLIPTHRRSATSSQVPLVSLASALGPASSALYKRADALVFKVTSSSQAWWCLVALSVSFIP